MTKVKINDKEVELERNDGVAKANGIDFDGHYVLWSFDYKPFNYLKESELSGDEYRKGGYVTIYRNGVSVFKDFCRSENRACVIIASKLPILQEFFWEYVKVGQKLYNHDVPCVIDSICSDGEILVKTEDGSRIPWAFKIEGEKNGESTPEEDEWFDKDRVHVTSEHLYWFRK